MCIIIFLEEGSILFEKPQHLYRYIERIRTKNVSSSSTFFNFIIFLYMSDILWIGKCVYVVNEGKLSCENQRRGSFSILKLNKCNFKTKKKMRKDNNIYVASYQKLQVQEWIHYELLTIPYILATVDSRTYRCSFLYLDPAIMNNV